MATPVTQSKRSHKREELFEKFSRNLDAIKQEEFVQLEPDIPGTYICPLCTRIFTKDALDQNIYPNPLTLEHVPPEALGGKPIVLTCKDCNSRCGADIDVELLKKHNWQAFNQRVPGAVVDAKIELHDGRRITGTISNRGANGLDIHLFKNGGRETAKKGKCPQIVQDDIKEHGIQKGALNFKLYKKRYPEAALLRIAYLLGFATFGNGFLLNSNLEKVREQIVSPEKEILDDFGILPYDFSSYEAGLYVVVEPEELQAFLAIFRIGGNCTCNVLLPGPSDPGLDVYNYLATHDLANDTSINLVIRKCPGRDYLANEENKFDATRIWNALVAGNYQTLWKKIWKILIQKPMAAARILWPKTLKSSKGSSRRSSAKRRSTSPS